MVPYTTCAMGMVLYKPHPQYYLPSQQIRSIVNGAREMLASSPGPLRSCGRRGPGIHRMRMRKSFPYTVCTWTSKFTNHVVSQFYDYITHHKLRDQLAMAIAIVRTLDCEGDTVRG